MVALKFKTRLLDENRGGLTQKRQTSARGNVSELKVATAYVEAGFAVSMPIGEGTPYDLIVDTGERLLKAQVKTGRFQMF